MKTREFILSTVIVSTLGIPMTEPAFALQLTQEEKEGILTRCLKAGGTLKACCAGADGTLSGHTCSVRSDVPKQVSPSKK